MVVIIVAASLVLSSHVRSMDPVIGPAFAEGLAKSQVIRRLVEIIDASDVIVYLARGDCPRPAVACVMIARSAPGVRHVRINFRLPIGLGKPGGWHKDDLSVAIAHELQHVVEITAWPEVVDGGTMEAAYTRRGLDRGGAHLDTDAAIQAGNDRRAELRGPRR
jgi:hypothetical protein